MLAEDPDLISDLKRLKRETKTVGIDAQDSLAKIVRPTGGSSQDLFGESIGAIHRIPSEVERKTKSITGAITENQIQNYHETFKNSNNQIGNVKS